VHTDALISPDPIRPGEDSYELREMREIGLFVRARLEMTENGRKLVDGDVELIDTNDAPSILKGLVIVLKRARVGCSWHN